MWDGDGLPSTIVVPCMPCMCRHGLASHHSHSVCYMRAPPFGDARSYSREFPCLRLMLPYHFVRLAFGALFSLSLSLFSLISQSLFSFLSFLYIMLFSLYGSTHLPLRIVAYLFATNILGVAVQRRAHTRARGTRRRRAARA